MDIARRIEENLVGHDGTEDGRNAFAEKDPLPACQAGQAIHAEDEAADDVADTHGNSQGHVEIAEGPGFGHDGEPVIQVVNDAGIKACFGGA